MAVLILQPGDFIKVAFKNEETGESESMWVRVDRLDRDKRIAFGRLDSEPLVNPDLRLGQELAVSFDNIVEHAKESSFGQ